MRDANEALIIGSGIGGLSTAIILAKLGYKVSVIEKNNKPGGLMRSYKRNGIECPVGVHYIGSMDDGQTLRRIFDYLGVTSKIPIERMGKDGIIDRYLFNDFEFDLPEGIDAFEHNLKEKFPQDSSQITKIIDRLRIASEKMHTLYFLYSTINGTPNDTSLHEMTSPIGDFLRELKCSPGLISVLGVTSGWIGVPLNECPAFFHNMTLASYLLSSWRLKCSGTDMAEAFASRLKELGGNIILNDEVKNILVDNRIIKGVELNSGLTINAPLVIAAVHPKMMINLLPQGAVKPAYIKRISKLVDTDGVFSVHLGVDASHHKELPHNIFKLQTENDGTLSNMAFYQLRESEKKGMNLLTIIENDYYDKWIDWENTFTGKRGDEYISKKNERADKLINDAAGIFGPISGTKILDIYTPLSIRDWMNSPNGSAYGVLRSSQQMIRSAMLNYTQVKGLYIAGQSVQAPGILGTAIGSLNTVKYIIGPERFREEVNVSN